MVSENGVSTKDAALDLARRGWLVFPVRPRDKVPATKNGFKNASSEPDKVAELFAGKDGHNLGVATGPDSGIWVLDLDGSEVTTPQLLYQAE